MTKKRAVTEPGGSVVIEADSITKRFGGATALDGVSISVRAGEIYGIVGENGAGKSTLMRILSGILEPDGGQVLVDGKQIEHGAKAALDAGISLVHQELSLVPEMTTAENIVLGSTPARSGVIDSAEMKLIASEALDEIGVSVDLDEKVSRLSVALRQFVEIARAVARKPRVLILDEPTATLTPAETDYLLAMLQRLAERGLAIVYISHRIPEIFAVCDRVTVLRDGQLIETKQISDTSPRALVDQMVGRELKADLEVRRESNPGDVVVSARGITAPGVKGIDLDVRAGEIVGLGGLVGAGRTEFVRAMIGADPKSGGTATITVDGTTKRLSFYTNAVRDGVAYVPEERRKDGLSMTLTVRDNVALPNRWNLSVGSVLNFIKIKEYATEFVNKVGLRPPRLQNEASTYSGGNQQKIVIAKWLGREPKFIVLDEPTRGVDVGAKAEIHRLVRELADRGTAVLVVSSDLPELLELSDVIHVIRDGQIQGTLSRDEADESSVMLLAAGGETGVAA